MSQLLCRWAFVICLVGLGATVAAQEKEEAQKDDLPGSEGAETFKVEPGPFKVEVTVDGIFEATETAEVSLQPEVWSAFKVLEAVEPGKAVAEGDTLVTFDDRQIEEDIRDIEAGQQLADMNVSITEKELAFLELFQPLDLQAMQRAKRVADEDLAWFMETDRALQEKSANESKKSAGYWLEYAQEELKQLEQMYKEDDLTEETEEIILKRARRRVDSSRFSLEQTTARSDHLLEAEIPRRAEQLESTAPRKDLDLQKAEMTFPMILAKKRMELEKLAYDRMKTNERLEKLQSDLELMSIPSPGKGVVYYGRAERGQWTGTESMTKQLRRGGSISAHQVFMTIVQARPLAVRTELPEKALRYLAAGVPGKVVPTAYPDLKLAGTVSAISAIPIKSGTFDATVTVELGEGAEAIMPGMACSVTLVPYEKTDALAVPKSAVFPDELDEEKMHVYLATGDGKHKRQPVVLGKHGAKKVEVLEGLTAGDEILLEKPT